MEDRAKRSILVAAGLSLGAAGLNPQVTSPAWSTVQAAIREQPQINSLLLLATLAAAGLLFVGGILACEGCGPNKVDPLVDIFDAALA